MTVEIESTDNTYQKLNKLLPADATGAFLSVQLVINQFTESLGPDEAAKVSAWSVIAVIVIIATLLPLYSKFLLKIDNSRQRWFLTGTFIVWAAYLSQDNIYNWLKEIKFEFEYVGLVLEILMVVWTLLVSPIITGLIDTSNPAIKNGV